MKRIKADAWLLLVALIWGATFPLVKLALYYLPPFTFNTIRFALSVVIFLLLLPILRVDKFIIKETSKIGIKIGLVVFLGYSLQTLGMEYSSATNAGYITSLYVVLTPIVARTLYGSIIRVKDVVCTCSALFGMFLMSYSGITGNLMLLGCALAFAIEIAMISHNSKLFCPFSLAFWQIFSVSLFSIPFSIFEITHFKENLIFAILKKDVLVALIVTAILATVVARILQNRYQRYTTPTDAAVIFSLEGVFSHIFSLIFLGEKLSLIQYVGAVIIVISVMAVSL